MLKKTLNTRKWHIVLQYKTLHETLAILPSTQEEKLCRSIKMRNYAKLRHFG